MNNADFLLKFGAKRRIISNKHLDKKEGLFFENR